MATCDKCGNEYAHTFTITKDDGSKGTFDSFECAAEVMAPRCAHCGCTVLGHGVAANNKTYCCGHCARVTAGAEIHDAVYA